MALLSEKEKQFYINYFDSQTGRPYPCSNQIVLCGIVTHAQTQAINYMNKHSEYQLIRKSCNQLIWKNFTTNEQWLWIRPTLNIRGYRFYKIKISSNIEIEDFYEKILPCCTHYCKSMEFI